MNDRSYRIDRLTDIMARVLHYQDRGEPEIFTAATTYGAVKREMERLPQSIVDRYRNDARFHAQVQRAVAMVLELDRSSDQTTGEQK